MCFLYKKTVYSKCGMLHKSLKCVIFQALAGLLVWFQCGGKNPLVRESVLKYTFSECEIFEI